MTALKKTVYSNDKELLLVLMIPTTIMALSSSMFSGLGVLTVLHASIPVIASISIILLINIRIESYLWKALFLILFWTPFYSVTALSDWHFTFFDVKPQQANVEIEKGFGKGIHTNQYFKNLYDWIDKTAQEFTLENDYIISYVVSPMVHMIAKRKPAFDDTFISFGDVPLVYFEKTLQKMKNLNRHPKIAFVFESMPILLPVPSEENRFQWAGKQFNFSSNDPISKYVIENMQLLDVFKLSEGNVIKCYGNVDMINQDRLIHNSIVKTRELLKQNPDDHSLGYKLGMLYEKNGEKNTAVEFYKKALDLNPEFIPALNRMAMINIAKGDYDATISIFEKILEIQPDNIIVCYNLSCIYAMQNMVDESIEWLKHAIDKGYDNWEEIENDKDFENIRSTLFYKKLMETHRT